MNHLEEIWKEEMLYAPPGYEKTAAKMIDAVIRDLRESYSLAMAAGGFNELERENIQLAVEDAICNNYDFLPDGVDNGGD